MSSSTNRITVFNNFFSLICSQPRDKQNRARDFFPFGYFLNNQLLTVSWKLRFQNSSNYCYKKWTSQYWIKRGHGLVQYSVKKMCAKFKVDRFIRFRTGARKVFTTQKPFPREIPLTMKTAVLGKLPPGKFPSGWFSPDNSHPKNPHQRKCPPRISPTLKIPTQDNSHLENFHPG